MTKEELMKAKEEAKKKAARLEMLPNREKIVVKRKRNAE